MLSEFLLQFKTQFSFFNLFEYLTFKTAISAITALIVSFVIGPLIIKTLKKYQIGEEIRHNGPKSHLTKNIQYKSSTLFTYRTILVHYTKNIYKFE